MHNINRKNCVEAWRGEQRGAVDFSQPMPDKVWAAQEGDPMRPDWFPRSLYGHQSDNASRFELALDPVTPKKLPWKSPRTEFTPVKGLFPQRAGQSRPRPEGVHPSFARILNRGETFRGLLGRRVPKRHLTVLVELASYARPRCGEPSARRIAGEVIEHGRMRSGAGHEARELSSLPVKRKADACIKHTPPHQRWKRAQTQGDE